MQGSAAYNLVFAACVCFVCAVVVSSSNVLLADLQNRNALLDKQRNVLLAAGFVDEEERLTSDEVEARFEPIDQILLDLDSGEIIDGVDPGEFDQRAATNDPTRSRVAPDNAARVPPSRTTAAPAHAGNGRQRPRNCISMYRTPHRR